MGGLFPACGLNPMGYVNQAGGRAAAIIDAKNDLGALVCRFGARADFLGPIYGGLRADTQVPSDAAPIFAAVASDDPVAQVSTLKLYSVWKAAGVPIELHVFKSGGHGWGMRKQDKTSDHWVDEFFASIFAGSIPGSFFRFHKGLFGIVKHCLIHEDFLKILDSRGLMAAYSGHSRFLP